MSENEKLVEQLREALTAAAAALTAAEARIKMLEEALGNVAVLVKHADENFRSEDYGVAYPALAVAVETARQALTGASNDG